MAPSLQALVWLLGSVDEQLRRRVEAGTPGPGRGQGRGGAATVRGHGEGKGQRRGGGTSHGAGGGGRGQTQLGFVPTPVTTGLRQTVADMRAQGLVQPHYRLA